MWYYHNQSISSLSQLPDWELLIGFVYVIECRQPGELYGKTYYGKKNFYSRTKKPLTKKEISTDKRLKTYKHVVKESNWKLYYGSNADLKADIKRIGASHFRRDIVELARSSKELSYMELKLQVMNNVLSSNHCYNSNILGRFYRTDLFKQQKT